MRWLLPVLLLWQGVATPAAPCHWDEDPDTAWVLPPTLDEISGIALAPGGRILAHDDERGKLVALDPATARVVGSWPLAGHPADDFEGIAVVGTRVFLLSSRGVLYQTGLPASPGALPFTVQRTGLDGWCEFEGLGAERGGAILLLACKQIRRDGRDVGLRIVRWDLARATTAAPASIDISESVLRSVTPWKRFEASALDVDPVTGNILVLSARQHGILELTASGTIVRARELAAGRHRQPEGLAILPGGIQLVSDEASGARATLSRYRCR